MPPITIQQTSLPGVLEIKPAVMDDHRGVFVKTFHEDLFAECGLATRFAEEYYSVSRQRVLRGLHFQLPPHEHTKMVYCVWGRILDAVVDLRVGSPTLGRFALIELTAERPSVVYVPSGLAHGFYVLSDVAVVMYKVSTVYAPEYDGGILWNSAGVPWPDPEPILSERDRRFIAFADFRSPFRYEGDACHAS
jgi:dTDP-4-dehydrorhamnose 3,5-epimerase